MSAGGLGKPASLLLLLSDATPPTCTNAPLLQLASFKFSSNSALESRVLSWLEPACPAGVGASALIAHASVHQLFRLPHYRWFRLKGRAAGCCALELRAGVCVCAATMSNYTAASCEQPSEMQLCDKARKLAGQQPGFAS